MNATFFIVTALLDILLNKVSKLNKRAQRHNLPAIKLTVHTDKERKSYKSDYKVTPVTLTGDNPTVAGDWKLVAYLRNVRGGESMTVCHLTDDYRVPADLKNGTHCDHCNTNRYRKFVAVLRNDSNGEVKKIGSSCLQDFLPLTSIHSAAHWNTLEEAMNIFNDADEMSDCDEEKFRSYGVATPSYYNMTEYLAHVCKWILKNGEFVSRSKAREMDERRSWDRAAPFAKTATADLAIRDFDLQDREPPAPEDFNIARAAIAYCETELVKQDDPNDYISNMIAVVCGAENLLEHKHCGLVASLVTLHQRDLDHKARETAKAQLGASEYFGEIKKRDTFSLTLTGTNEFDGMYGTTYLYRFVDADNNTAVWFSSKNCDLSKGETYQVKGTVKEHKQYRDTKQTVLTRCVVL